MRRLRTAALALLGAGLAGIAPACAASPNVIVSIKPVHSLVAGVMAGVAEPDLLLDGAASEHSVALRPSQASALAKADLIFWIGPQLETFLIRPLESISASAVSVPLSQSAGVRLLPVRQAGDLTMSQAPETPAVMDMHIWLDPENAVALVAEISARLQARDAVNAAIYARNAQALTVRLQASGQQIAARLRAAPPAPYMVFHDAYHYFEARFGIQPVAAISADPERLPGAGRIRALRTLIIDAGVVCAFAEPQFEPRMIGTVIENSPARAAVLDPLGAAIEAGPDMYFQLLDQITDGLTQCSGKQGAQ